ncbi:MAG: plasmid mobilization relaxosome protein MobC [Alphaproteobacteria bacterium]|nr:plasmid mobilization relaxosome protein MobC [Alphaproteobacteria bacterium]
MARRKQADASEQRTKFLGVQLTPKERGKLERAAEGEGISLSAYARQLLFRRQAAAEVVAETRRNPEAKALAGELRAIGNNLNQVARELNGTGTLRDWGELREVIGLHKRAFERVIAL